MKFVRQTIGIITFHSLQVISQQSQRKPQAIDADIPNAMQPEQHDNDMDVVFVSGYQELVPETLLGYQDSQGQESNSDFFVSAPELLRQTAGIEEEEFVMKDIHIDLSDDFEDKFVDESVVSSTMDVQHYRIQQQVHIENDDIDQFIYIHEDEGTEVVDEYNPFGTLLEKASTNDDDTSDVDPSDFGRSDIGSSSFLSDPFSDEKATEIIDYDAAWNVLMDPICKADTAPLLRGLQVFTADMLQDVEEVEEYEEIYQAMLPVQRRKFSSIMHLELHNGAWSANLDVSVDLTSGWQVLVQSGEDTVARIRDEFGVECAGDLHFLSSEELKACLPGDISFVRERKFLVSVCIEKTKHPYVCKEESGFANMWNIISNVSEIVTYLSSEYSIESWEDLSFLNHEELIKMLNLKKVDGNDVLRVNLKKSVLRLL